MVSTNSLIKNIGKGGKPLRLTKKIAEKFLDPNKAPDNLKAYTKIKTKITISPIWETRINHRLLAIEVNTKTERKSTLPQAEANPKNMPKVNNTIITKIT